MMSHTIRYIKLMYIVIGTLINNDAVCETIDEIQIAAHVSRKKNKNMENALKVTTKSIKHNSNNSNNIIKNNNNNNINNINNSNSSNKSNNNESSIIRKRFVNTTKTIQSTTNIKCWLTQINKQFLLDSFKSRLHSLLDVFNVWILPKYILEYSIKLFHSKLIISSDCDMIYK